MLSVASLQPALQMQPSITFSPQSPAPAPRIPTPEYIANRLHCIANYKLRLEAAHSEPCLRKLLGHIYVYDAIREHKQTQATQSLYISPPMARRRQQQLRLRQLSDTNRLSHSLAAITEDTQPETEAEPESDNAADIQELLSYVSVPPTVSSSQAADLDTFRRAIAFQLATLSQVRIEAASRQLYNMTRDADDDDELAVEEYESDEDDGGSDSDYDSYDGEGGWREREDVFDEDEGEGADSDTEPESGASEPPSPIAEEMMVAALCEGKAPGSSQTQGTGACYFLPLRPVPASRRRGSAAAMALGDDSTDC